MEEAETTNNNDILERLYNYRREAKFGKTCHYQMSNRAESRANMCGFAVTVLSTVVGTAIFATVSKGAASDLKSVAGWLTCAISILAAVLSSLQTFWGFAGTADKNKKAALQYETIYNKIESVFLNYRIFENKITMAERKEILTRITDILADFEKASASAPNIPNGVAAKFDVIKNPKRKLDIE